MSVHVVLGARGVIGQETVAALAGTDEVIAVARGPVVVPDGVQTRQADLLDVAQARTAVAGADVVHLVAGLRYDHTVWAREWPVIVRNAAGAARNAGARLVCLDNVYAYGRVQGPMREDTPLRPISRKGRVRAEARELLLSFPNVVVGVAADFYGPGAHERVQSAGDRRAGPRTRGAVALRRRTGAFDDVHARHRQRAGGARPLE